jgi:nucleotide-binding universal stress UspA family protein
MKKILFATDYSEIASNAFDYAIHLADEMDLDLIAVHISPSPAFTAHTPGDMMDITIQEDRQADMDKIIKSIEGHKLYAKRKFSIKPDARQGLVVDQIVKAAHEGNVELIIIGTHGQTGLKDWFFGNHASEIIRKSGIPVMAIPPDVKYAKIKRIAYAIDFKDFDKSSLRQLIDMMKAFKAKLTLLHIDVEKDNIDDTQLINFRKYVEETYNIPGLEFKFLQGEDVFSLINDFAEENHIDIVAMKHRKDSFLDLMLHRSITQLMTLTTTKPLLVFHR